MKRTLFTISVILIIIIASVALFLISKSEFEERWSNKNVEEFITYMYPITEEKYVASIFISKILTEEDVTILSIFSEKELPIIVEMENEELGNIEELEEKNILGNIVYPAFLSLIVEKEEKNIIDELLCGLRKGEYCIKEVEVKELSLLKSSYPYPSLSEKDSKEFFAYNLDKGTSTPTASDEQECQNLLSEYLLSNRKGIDTSGVYKEIEEMECNDPINLLYYSSLLTNGDPLYNYTKDLVCKNVEQNYDGIFGEIFSEKEIEKLENLCIIEIEEDGYTQVWKEGEKISKEILLVLEGEDGLDIKDFVGTQLYTSTPSPYCVYMYACTLEINNLSKIMFELE